MAKKVLSERHYTHQTSSTLFPPVASHQPPTVTLRPTLPTPEIQVYDEVDEEDVDEEDVVVVEEDVAEDKESLDDESTISESSIGWKGWVMIAVSILGILVILGVYLLMYKVCGKCFKLNEEFEDRMEDRNPRRFASCMGMRFKKRSKTDMDDGGEGRIDDDDGEVHPLLPLPDLATIMEEDETGSQEQQQQRTGTPPSPSAAPTSGGTDGGGDDGGLINLNYDDSLEDDNSTLPSSPSGTGEEGAAKKPKT